MKPSTDLRVADARDPEVAQFLRNFPGWLVWTHDDQWCAMRTGVSDGLVGVTAGSLDDLRHRLSEALKATR